MSNKYLFLLLLMLYGGAMHAQTRQITGTVSDADGVPLAGASVMIRGSNRGTSTNEDGNFTLGIPASAETVLSVNMIGFRPQEVTVTDQQVLTIVLQVDDAALLDEAVAVGYGTVRRGDLTGSVGSVSSETLLGRGTTSAMAALQGAVAGVDISSNSVKPGGGFSIQIRGQNSMAAGDPLYVVDGVVTSNIDFINPADIEKIDVVKDASSTAIYGSRGSSGVVIVKTKNAGAPGTPRTTITYDGYYGIRELARIPDFMDGREWVDFRTSAFYTYANDRYSLGTPNTILQNSPLLESRLFNEEYEDWLGLGTRTGRQQNHYLGIAGASEKLTYNLGVGYQQEVGNFLKEDLNRYTLKLSVEHKTSDYFSTGASINFVHGVNNAGSEHGY